MIIAANWKMNPSRHAAEELVQSYARIPDSAGKSVQIVCFPPSCYFDLVAAGLKNTKIQWGGQTCHHELSGAHTGELSASMISECGGNWVILGHSERRQNNDETSSLVSVKLKTALAAGLTSIICVGEGGDIRQAGQQDRFVQDQLEASLACLFELDAPQLKAALLRVIIAYEPVWAIGTGMVANITQIETMHHGLIEKLKHLCGDSYPQAGMAVLYGGSVNSDNAKDILANPMVGGALVGGASLSGDGFMDICLSI